MRRKGNPFILLEMQTGTATVENSMAVTQKSENRITIWPSNSIPGYIPGKKTHQKDTHTPMSIALLFTIAKIWKQPKYPSTDEWIKKVWYTTRAHGRTKHEQWKTCSVTQSCPTLCSPRDYSPPGSTVPGIFQARILEWVAISFFGEPSLPMDQTQDSCISCVTGEFFTTEPSRKPSGVLLSL